MLAQNVVGTAIRRVCVVQGASRGIGLELTRQLAARGDVVFACCRAPDRALELRKMEAAQPNSIAVLRLDVEKPCSIAAAAAELEGHPLAAHGGRAAAVDLLVNTSAVLKDDARGLAPERSLSQVEADAVATSFAVNALGPLLVMRHFSPLLRRAAAHEQVRPAGTPGSTAIFYSARVGSIGDNQTGGWYAYRASKAALNQFVRCMSLEMKRHRVCCTALHPGTVDTDLTRAFLKARAKYDVQDVSVAVEKHLAVMDSLTMEDSGRFFDWRKDEVPW
eukprot:TRINITY_DN15871_c0_g1_i1.p1 TRINITY_DN15871_c0_g1~~TRINITY_DN15871_c0_g1_i1.p1  ORF type:complete len:289 (-),score=50.89 TRINITY_DN15871_c0_g1_i1:192-1022(-)